MNDQYTTQDSQQHYTGSMPPPGWSPPPPRSARKSAAAASLLSMMPGIGQIYCGFYQRGFLHIAVVATLIVLLSSDSGFLAPFFGLFLAFFWIYNVIDAARCAQAVNRAAVGGVDEELPELPFGFGGSRTAGLVFIGLGIFLLGVIHLDFDFEWLADWWPVGLILIGANMLRKAR